jgi:hypothetical protein
MNVFSIEHRGPRRSVIAVYDGRCFARAASVADYFFSLALLSALLFVVSLARGVTDDGDHQHETA